ncbi:MAG TPA: hypothetical protein PKK59_09235 [Anaerolineaceae bacterium]|nr:hypothetical protein [Anaerolineaceae bacterium]
MRIKILMAIVLTLSLILSGCAEQPTSQELVKEKLAVILTQSALQAQQTQPGLPEQPAAALPTGTPLPPPPAPGTPPEPTPDARINITAIQQIGPGQAIVNWDGIGSFPSGFNVVWTREERRPVSPQDDGSYTSDPYARAAMFAGEPGYVYIVRVCRFTGAGCDVYSNTAFFNFRRYAPTPTPNRTATARALTPIVSGGGGGGGGTSATAAPKFAITSITNAGGLKARMLWTSDSNPSRGFRIYYSTGNENPKYGSDSYFSISDGDEREAYVDGKAGTTYYYRICKFNGSGCDAYTPSFEHTYPGTAAKPLPTKVPEPTAVVDNSTILVSSIVDGSAPGTATIYWGASGSFPEGFKVLYSASNDEPTISDMFVDAPQGATQADVTGMPNTLYYFRVCKVAAGTCTVYSAVKQFTFAEPYPEFGFTLRGAANTNPGEVELTWVIEQGNEPSAGYLLLWDLLDDPSYPDDVKPGVIDKALYAYTVTGLATGTYNFRLCKYDGVICTAYSSILGSVAVTVP